MNVEQTRSGRSGIKLSVQKLSFGVFVASLFFFCMVQLVSVSLLSPKGKDLKALDVEKEFLVEENRDLEQEAARMTSLPIIKNRAEKELSMGRTENVMYVTSPSTTADISVE